MARDITYEHDAKNNVLVVRVPLPTAKTPDELPKTKTGKSRRVATTHGVVRSEIKLYDRTLRVGINMFIPDHDEA